MRSSFQSTLKIFFVGVLLKIQTIYKKIEIDIEVNKTPSYRPGFTQKFGNSGDAIDWAQGRICYYEILIQSKKGNELAIHHSSGHLMSECHKDVVEELEILLEEEIFDLILEYWEKREAADISGPPWKK